MPTLGYGTFLAKPGEIGPALKVALEAGYRHIDCAFVYENEKEIGIALQEVFAEGKLKREDIFITSKLPVHQMSPSEVLTSLSKTLSDLQTSYLDLYLVHLCTPITKVDGKPKPLRNVGWGLQDVWRAMEAQYNSGKAKAIGISNYPTALLNDLLCYAKVLPAVHQIERHPFLVQKKHVQFCKDNNIVVTAYASLGAPTISKTDLTKNEIVVKIAHKHHKTPAQVLLRWSLDTDVIAIPKSVTPDRICENFKVWDFKLTPEEIAELSALDQNLRFFSQDWVGVPPFT